jgi:uncharacterized repeat protein (TIGR01451 family)
MKLYALKFFLLSLACFFSFRGLGQQTMWARALGVTSDAKQMVTDKASNVYLLRFGPGNELGIHKYNKNGQAIWTRTLTLSNVNNIDYRAAIDLDTAGNVIFGGTFSSSLPTAMDFDPGPGIANLTTAGYSDCFVEKLDSAGNFQWVKQFGNQGRDKLYSLKTDKQGNIIFTGTVEGTIDFDPGPGVSNSTGADGDLYVCKLSNAGNLLQVVRMGQQTQGGKLINPNSLTLDPSDNILITGDFSAFQDSIDFNPGAGTFFLAPFSLRELFVLKLDKSMNFQWVKRITSPSANSQDNVATCIRADLSGNVYVTGQFRGTIDADPGPGVFNLQGPVVGNIFIIKLNTAGNLLYARHIGNNVGYSYPAALAFDSSVNLLVTGSFQNTVDFDPGPGVANLSSAGGYNVFGLKLSPLGDYLWSKRISSTASDAGTCIAVDAENRIYMAGNFAGALLSFDGAVFLQGTIGADEFIARLSDFNNILGTTYFDANGNGTKDAGEFNVPGIVIRAASATKTYLGYSDFLGAYNLLTDTGNYTISIPQLPTYYTASLPATHTANFGTAIGQIDSANHFGLVPLPNKNDLQVKITNITAARPGFKTVYRVTCKNAGTTTLSGNITLAHAAQLVYVSATPAPTGYSNPVINWNFSNLRPLHTIHFDVMLDVPVSTVIGSTQQSIATANPITGDETPLNNRDTLNHVVTASYDPNDKSVTPNGNISPTFVAAGEPLDYTIRFQNTGTDTAFNIVVRDTLSSNLNVNSFEFIAASHPCIVNLRDNGIVEWRFNNILLPDSNRNEPLSHGFIRFRVKPKSTLVIGNQITNVCNIGFDFNAYIRTNQTLNTVTLATSVSNLPGTVQQLSFYPNPFQKELRIANIPAGKTYRVELLTLSGRLAGSYTINAGNPVIRTGYLPNMLYFLKVFDAKTNQQAGQTFKVVKIE